MSLVSLRRSVARQLRRCDLLPLAERALYSYRFLRCYHQNQEAQKLHPGFTFPPYFLAYDAYGTCSRPYYMESGRRHAHIVFENLKQFIESKKTSPDPLRVLEWGCGPARVIRPLKELFKDNGFNVEMFGSDYNTKTIDWCQNSIKDIQFSKNNLTPPFPFKDESFDLIYSISVFTHLSEELHFSWLDEVLRILKPGGIFLFSVHGDRVKHLLVGEEQELYNSGQFVARTKVLEGSRLYSSYQSPTWLRHQLLKNQKILISPDETNSTPVDYQDFWMIQK